MAMSSFLINSNYIEPKFPPCEEYAQNNYLHNQSPEYYERPREPGFEAPPEALYQGPSTYQEATYGYSHLTPNHEAGVTQDGLPGKGQSQQLLQSHVLRQPPQHCEPIGVSNDSIHTEKNAAASAALKCKEPVVYPWMKKIHCNIGKISSFCCMRSLGLPAGQGKGKGYPFSSCGSSLEDLLESVCLESNYRSHKCNCPAIDSGPYAIDASLSPLQFPITMFYGIPLFGALSVA